MTHKEFLKYLGMEMKVARIRADMTVERVASLTGLSKATISDVEAGRTDAKVLTLKRICDVLNVSLKDVL